jgi:hypothetical protein
MCFLREEIIKKILSFFSPARLQPKKMKYGEDMVAIHQKKITSYKFMGGIDSSDMMLYTYLHERRTVRYSKKTFNVTARMALNTYILYKENYRGPGKLKSRYNYTVPIIKSLGEKWLALKVNAGAEGTTRTHNTP